MTAAVRMAIRRRSGRACSACRPAAASAALALSTILDRGGLDLDIALEFLGEWPVGDGDFLADDLIRTVLAGGLDADRVGAGAERLAVVVPAVPGDGILPRRAGGARDRVDQARIVGEPAGLVVAIPALEVGGPARAGPPGHEPEGESADGLAVLVLEPDGDIGASVASCVPPRAADLEVYEQLVRIAPRAARSGLRIPGLGDLRRRGGGRGQRSLVAGPTRARADLPT